jgi:holliday junction DNA helicase RuvA
MLDRLRGTVLEVDRGHVVLDVGGVGYDVAMSLGAAERLLPGTEGVVLFVHPVYGADRQDLYGFAGKRDRAAFRDLLGVAGVGPRTALAVFSALHLDDLRTAVLREDAKALLAVSGVGKKLAGRLLLELKDKALAWTAEAPSAAAPATGSRADDERAVAVLTNLGYRPAQALRAVESARRALGEDAAFDVLVRAALADAV